VRTHCFISTTSAGARGARWLWHTADENGVTRKRSETLFDNFNACVDDARAHGYRHVEVPVLHWSTMQEPRELEGVALTHAPEPSFSSAAGEPQ
jgi:hypothetical protein